MPDQAPGRGTGAALKAAEVVARELDIRFGEISFHVQDGHVHAIDVRTRRDRRDEEQRLQQLREGSA